MTVEPGSQYIDTVLSRLENAGYRCARDATGEGAFDGVGHRSGFAITKVGFSETFVVLSHVDLPSAAELRAYSNLAFHYSVGARKHRLPLGVFEGVTCFAVAIVPSIEESVALQVRSQAPTPHWASAEIPVVFDSSSGRLHYFERTPFWGFAYYAGYRRTIRKLLSP